MPIWKRIGWAAFFGLGGGGAAVWGLYGMAVWVHALLQGQASIETENIILGFPLVGFGLAAISVEFIVPRWVSTWPETRRTWFGGVVLGSLLVGGALLLLGQPVLTIIMEVGGYRPCIVQGRGRYLDVVWGRPEAACHTEQGR